MYAEAPEVTVQGHDGAENLVWGYLRREDKIKRGTEMKEYLPEARCQGQDWAGNLSKSWHHLASQVVEKPGKY